MYVVRVPVDTYLFNAAQLHPRSVLGFAYGALRTSYGDISWPRLLREWKFGFVISRVTVDYEDALRFFDADELEVSSVMSRVRDDAMRWVIDLTVAGTGRPPAARIRVVLAPVEVAEQEALTAKPAPIPDALAAKLAAGEVTLDRRAERVRDLAARIAEQGALLGEHRHEFVVDRTMCEVADQWYFPDIPRLLEPAREAIAFAHVQAEPRLVAALSQPLRRLDIELSRPYFWRQRGEIHARAYAFDGRLVFVHHLQSTSPIAERCGIAIETW